MTFDEFKEELGPIDILPLMNSVVCLAVTTYLGGSLWKAACIAVFVFVATKYHYGRRTLIKIGILSAIVISPFWLGIAPPLTDLAEMARSFGSIAIARAQSP